MKKVLITMAVLTSMVAGAMVFSSFVAPKTNDETVCSQISVNDEWTRIGFYYGYDSNGRQSNWKFSIWVKQGEPNTYYWVYADDKKPDQLIDEGQKGVLRQNSEKKWYAAYKGIIYFIDF